MRASFVRFVAVSSGKRRERPETRKPAARAGFRSTKPMGGTRLEPVTPSLSSARWRMQAGENTCTSHVSDSVVKHRKAPGGKLFPTTNPTADGAMPSSPRHRAGDGLLQPRPGSSSLRDTSPPHQLAPLFLPKMRRSIGESCEGGLAVAAGALDRHRRRCWSRHPARVSRRREGLAWCLASLWWFSLRWCPYLARSRLIGSQ
jgi:hypothetical protein